MENSDFKYYTDLVLKKHNFKLLLLTFIILYLSFFQFNF